MPTFKYLILNKSKRPEYIEVEQSITEAPLKKHPVTGEPIKRVPQSQSLTLNHSEKRDQKTLSADHLQKHGFSVLQKEKGSQKYIQTVGNHPELKDFNE